MSFERAFEIVIGAEGGLVDDPADPGGLTKYGISQRTYPKLDIRNLTLEQAREIYQRDYWEAAGCDLITNPVLAILVFDAAVNMSVERAQRLEITHPDPIEFQAERALYYAHLSTFPRFGRGWMRRLFRVLLQSGAQA